MKLLESSVPKIRSESIAEGSGIGGQEINLATIQWGLAFNFDPKKTLLRIKRGEKRWVPTQNHKIK